MSQFWENLRTDRRTDGRIDTLFYTTLLAEAGVQKMNFHLSAQKIRWKSFTKYLGHFKDHISTSKQTNRVNRILDKLRHCLPSDILKNSNLFLTHMFIMPVRFGDQGNNDTLVMVQRAQNNALRIVNFKEERHPCEAVGKRH